MQIYICLGLAIAVISGIVYMSLTPKKQLNVTLDDIVDLDAPPKKRAKAVVRDAGEKDAGEKWPGEQRESSKLKSAGKKGKRVEQEAPPEKRRAKVKRHPDADKTPLVKPKNKRAEEFDEDPYDKDTLYKTVDQNGPYPRGMTGAVEPEAFCRLRRTIVRHAYTVFMETKEELLKERISYLQRNMMKEYGNCIAKASDKYQRTSFEVTKLAAEYIDLDPHNFEASFKEAQAIP